MITSCFCSSLLRSLRLSTSALIFIFVIACQESGSKNRGLDLEVRELKTTGLDFNADGESPILIQEDLRLPIAGCDAWFNNLIRDSRSTVMAYVEWKRLILAASLSDEDAAKRVAMIGNQVVVYYLDNENQNKVMLVAPNDQKSPSKIWAEVWDKDAIQRVRVDFECSDLATDKIAETCRKLSFALFPETTE